MFFLRKYGIIRILDRVILTQPRCAMPDKRKGIPETDKSRILDSVMKTGRGILDSFGVGDRDEWLV